MHEELRIWNRFYYTHDFTSIHVLWYAFHPMFWILVAKPRSSVFLTFKASFTVRHIQPVSRKPFKIPQGECGGTNQKRVHLNLWPHNVILNGRKWIIHLPKYNLAQPFFQVLLRLPVAEVMDENEAVVVVVEDVARVQVALAASDVGQFWLIAEEINRKLLHGQRHISADFRWHLLFNTFPPKSKYICSGFPVWEGTWLLEIHEKLSSPEIFCENLLRGGARNRRVRGKVGPCLAFLG